MDGITTKQVGSFRAKSQDGNVYEILIFQDIHEVNTRGGTRTAPAMKKLRTARGEHVNRIAKGNYELVGITTIALTSDDPNAE